ncbi:MAG: hypothetical protein Q9169_007467, partial [Polycauliona sp. 2 TL-2023]
MSVTPRSNPSPYKPKLLHGELLGHCRTSKLPNTLVSRQQLLRETNTATSPPKIVSSLGMSLSPLGSQIFLTGATGFLGSHILAELLKTTLSEVCCIVRDTTPSEARRRIKSVFIGWGIWDDSFTTRIQVYCGDIRKERLGLQPDEYLSLARSVHTIYHAAAVNSYLVPYQELEEANMDGTVEVLKFAGSLIRKRVIYISSLSVFSEIANERESGEQRPVMPGMDTWVPEMITDYAETKWIAEHLVLNFVDIGGQALIIRPGRLMGNTVNFRCPRFDFMTSLIAGVLEVGIAPDVGPWFIDLTPVDFCARV